MNLALLPLALSNVPAGLRLALAQEGVPFQELAAGCGDARFVLFDSQVEQRPALTPGQTAIDVHALRGAGAEDPFDALLSDQSARQSWRVGELDAVETVALVDKRSAQQRLMTRLRAIVERRGGVWMRLAAFPYPYRGAFNFRIDYDEYDPADFAATLQAIDGHEEATSHFICGASYESQPEALRRLRGLDVGGHGYWHHTYRDYDDNLGNIRRSFDVLRRAGIEPAGFVSPHGRCNRGLLAALETLGVSHSSEFALAWDAAPFFPVLGGTKRWRPEGLQTSSVLQIPVHPVSLGVVLEAAQAAGVSEDDAADAASEYYANLIRERYHAREPIYLYGHPTRRLGRFPRVLRNVFNTALTCEALWRATLNDINAWWRTRAAAAPRVYRVGETFRVIAPQLPHDMRLGWEYCRGEHVALMALDRAELRFSPTALAYERRGAGPPAHAAAACRSAPHAARRVAGSARLGKNYTAERDSRTVVARATQAGPPLCQNVTIALSRAVKR